jgi:hypothetical protein
MFCISFTINNHNKLVFTTKCEVRIKNKISSNSNFWKMLNFEEMDLNYFKNWHLIHSNLNNNNQVYDPSRIHRKCLLELTVHVSFTGHWSVLFHQISKYNTKNLFNSRKLNSFINFEAIFSIIIYYSMKPFISRNF